MEINKAKKLIKKLTAGHAEFCMKADIADRYYRNQNDILFEPVKKDAAVSVVHNADNRVSHRFYGLLVDQKASYAFASPPLFDVGSNAANKRITSTLGDRFAKVCKDLCVSAANASLGWLHYWIDTAGEFKYSAIDSRQVIPVWSDDLNRDLLAVLRVYSKIEDNDGKFYFIYEYWTAKECQAFCREASIDLENGLKQCMMFRHMDEYGRHSDTDVFRHDLGRVPFLAFPNNNIGASDLDNVKALIDVYDKVDSGFVNDLQDIQEVIFILSGYGGTNLDQFLDSLKKYKTINLDADEGGKPGLSTLTIDIPVEAREKLLDRTRKEIFEQGQGVDPDPQNFGNSSGIALQFLYSLLELKTGLMETEFKLAFGDFVRVICDYLHIKCDSIIQTWTRTAIRNDAEIAEICSKSNGLISGKTIMKNHPFVEDADAEEKQLEGEKKKKIEQYAGAFPSQEAAEKERQDSEGEK